MIKVNRIYILEDLKMLEMARIFLNNFVIDKALFINKNPQFNDPFEDDFDDAIIYANSLPLSDEITTIISVLTEELNNYLPIIHSSLQELYTYTELAWDSKAKTYSFGKGEYNSLRQSAIKLTELLQLGYNMANNADNKPDLIAVGYSQTQIDALAALVTEITNKYNIREEMLANSKIATEERIKSFNDVWRYMKQINKTSKIVFADSPAKLKQYNLYN